MPEFKLDLRDMRFILKEQVGIESIASAERHGALTWSDLDLVLVEGERVAREVIHPLQEGSDRIGAKLVDGQVVLAPGYDKAFRQFTSQGWNAASVTPELGGQGLPHTMAAALADMFIGACPSFYFIPGLAHAAARVIEMVGTPTQRATYCKKMYMGTWGGTMCLTEAQAGTAVGDLRTVAERTDREGTYRIKGNKIFISAGDQPITENVIHMVLARTPDAPPGIKGVSLFIVPKRRLADGRFNDVKVTGVEEKMGLHGSPTCSLAFGDDDACEGEIVGREGEGIQHMFLMMNEARIAVGLQASSMANYAYQLALAYAKERVQGVDVTAMKDPMAPRVTIIEHPDVRRMLVSMKAFSEGIRALLLLVASYVDRHELATNEVEKDRYRALAELLTPICKAYGSYRAFEVVDMAIMVHGGYGYIREYGVEGLLRDVKIAAIYEGTNGVQALDLLGRKVAMKGGAAFMTFVGWMNEFIATHKSNAVIAPLIEKLETAKNTLVAITMDFGGRNMKGDRYYPVLHASNYLEMFGHIVLARVLVEQAAIGYRLAENATDLTDLQYYQGKLETARFFIHQVLPKVEALAISIRSEDRSVLEFQF